MIKNIKRGTNQFSGTFYYGAWEIKYGYKRKGLVYYSPKLDKAKQRRLKKTGETVKKVAMGIVTVGFYIGSRGATPVVNPI